MQKNSNYNHTNEDKIENILYYASINARNELSLPKKLLTSIPTNVFALGNLVTLDLHDNQITDIPSEIGKLQHLCTLRLSGNKIENLPLEIGQLRNLREIDLSECKLAHIPDIIFQLENLAVLHLDKNYLTQIQPEIAKLQNLRVLTVSNNKLQILPPEIGRLHQLRYLNLAWNKIIGLPKETRYLCSLRKLDLSHNDLEKFPKIITQLRNIRILKIRKGKLVELSPKIEYLQKLKILDLKSGELQSIPPTIAKIQTLETLILSRNDLRSLPFELKELGYLKHLLLNKNPLPIPPEILAKKDNPQIILDYYFSSIGGKKYPVNEIKLLFVGQGSVGKTSIINRIIQNTFNQDQGKTEGISINRLNVIDKRNINNQTNNNFKNQQSKIIINIWDFGGQEIMHATHRFFLTKRSLYLLVIDSRLSQEENRVEYWLKIIQSFGGASPVLIIGNKIDQQPLDIDRTGLQKKYPNIIGILETSAATGFGIEQLKEVIIKKVNRLHHIRDLQPETWFIVKTKLEALGRETNFITYDKYLELCVENKVSDETSQRTLIGFLHDLGVVLHFQDDPRLEALGILNPQWVTNGVYRILNAKNLFQNKGVLTVAMLDEILNLPEYPRGKRLFIVDMMKKFELCYDIEADKTFLVPDLLPKDEPHLTFNGIPAFEYAYPVLPSSIITRFIVRMNKHIDGDCVWRTGVVLKIGQNIALVKADLEDRKITIAIDGLEHTRRDALSAIRYQLDEIHGSIKGLNPEKRVPIPGAPNAEPLEYEYLLMLEREDDETCRVKDGSRLVTVNVRQILSGIESEAQRKQSIGDVTNVYIGNDFKGNLTVGDSNSSTTTSA